MTARKTPPRTAAIIEIGTSSIRMIVAERSGKDLRVLDQFDQAISLGRRTFSEGSIDVETTEACVNVLNSFCNRLPEYNVGRDDVHAVATSAVREASNREQFLDRAA